MTGFLNECPIEFFAKQNSTEAAIFNGGWGHLKDKNFNELPTSYYVKQSPLNGRKQFWKGPT